MAVLSKKEYLFHDTFVIYNHIELILRWKRHIIYVDAGRGQLGGCVLNMLNMISDAIPRGSLVTKLSRGIPGGHRGQEFTQTSIIIHK